jgi:predicted transcriptional regulator
METRTKIMYKAMLSNDQCKLYIQFLLKCGLIKEMTNGEKRYYSITESGNKFLFNFEKLKQMLPTIMEEDIHDHYNLTV